MPTLGITLNFADPSQGMIQAKRGMNLVTYGENIRVAVWPIDEYATGVQIVSTLVFGFDLWGRNQRNIAKINAAMSLYLDTWAPHLRRPRAD